jgi:hypothetical protein
VRAPIDGRRKIENVRILHARLSDCGRNPRKIVIRDWAHSAENGQVWVVVDEYETLEESCIGGREVRLPRGPGIVILVIGAQSQNNTVGNEAAIIPQQFRKPHYCASKECCHGLEAVAAILVDPLAANRQRLAVDSKVLAQSRTIRPQVVVGARDGIDRVPRSDAIPYDL